MVRWFGGGVVSRQWLAVSGVARCSIGHLEAVVELRGEEAAVHVQPSNPVLDLDAPLDGRIQSRHRVESRRTSALEEPRRLVFEDFGWRHWEWSAVWRVRVMHVAGRWVVRDIVRGDGWW